jgi:hypothetical protein
MGRMEARLAHLGHLQDCQQCRETILSVELACAEEGPCKFMTLMGSAARDWIYTNSCQRGRALLDAYTAAIARRLA